MEHDLLFKKKKKLKKTAHLKKKGEGTSVDRQEINMQTNKARRKKKEVSLGGYKFNKGIIYKNRANMKSPNM